MFVFNKKKNFSAKETIKKMKEKQQTKRQYLQNSYNKGHPKYT